YALAQLGFRALATTSAGFAWSMGRADNHVSLDQALAYFRAVAAAVAVPVSADFEGGFAVEPADVASNVTLAAQTGIAGLSIEDSKQAPASPLFDFSLAVERVAAASRAIDASGVNLVLCARSEGFIVGRPDLAETIRRLTAFAEAGADCLSPPGIKALWAAGVRRMSGGAALAHAAWTGFLEAASEIAGNGTFTGLGRAVPGG